MISRTRRVGASAVAILAFVISLGVAQGAATDDVLPDLVSDPIERPQLQTYTQPDGDHLLLRFDGYLHNRGPGAIEIRASDRSGTQMRTVIQRIYKDDGSFNTTDTDSRRSPQVRWEPADGHNHWHLKNASRYSLWNEGKTAEVAPSQKVGFCLTDSEPIEQTETNYQYSIGDPEILNCQDPGPPYLGGGSTATNVTTGISPGWRDKYTRSLAFQYVDVTDVAPGRYWIRSQADPNDVLKEANEANAAAFSPGPVTVPGYQALPIAAGDVFVTGASTLTLDSAAFESFDPTYLTTIGPRSFKIVEAPAHGTLSRAVGSSFTPASLTYTPQNGYLGPDSFKYVAYDSESAYPRHPKPATVSLNVGKPAPSVAISGAPASVVTGTSAQLSAVVLGDAPGVTWTVNGVAGGSALIGTITPSGLYDAPLTVPIAGSVKIRARSASGAFDEETVQIVPPPVQQPAPLPIAPATPTGGRVIAPSGGSTKRSLTGLKLGRSGRWLLVSVRSSKTGVVRTYAAKGWRTIGSCRTRATANRTLTCKIAIPKGVNANRLDVSVTLRVDGKLVETLKTKLANAKRISAHTAHGPHHHH